ncbi:MAG TPA: hypothetical protein VFE55_22055 [Acidimicrobiia bacterium]|nr:hypothetical protein [Acidimicrobiia bacterium]
MRVAALEDNVAFLEQWCEEQQDALDRAAGPLAYDYELEAPPPPRQILRVVDLRDSAPADGRGDGTRPEPDPSDGDVDVLVAVVETDHDRLVRQIRSRVDQLRRRLGGSGAPPAEPARPEPPEPEARPRPRPGLAPVRRVSAKQAGRTAP